MKEQIIAVNSNCYHGFSIKDAIEGAKSAGFKYIELSAIKGYTEHIFHTQTFEHLIETKDLLEKNEIKPIALSIHTNLMDDNCFDELTKNMRLAPFFGSKYIVTSIGDASEDCNKFSDSDIASRISALLQYLNRYDLDLVIETHGRHSTGDKMSKLCECINCNHVKINYDTANTIYWANISVEEMIADFANSIRGIGYMHLKDKLGSAHEWNFPALGKGNIPFEKIFSLINKTDIRCPLSVEIEFTENGPKDLDEINTAVKDSADYLKGLGLIL